MRKVTFANNSKEVFWMLCWFLNACLAWHLSAGWLGFTSPFKNARNAQEDGQELCQNELSKNSNLTQEESPKQPDQQQQQQREIQR